MKVEPYLVFEGRCDEAIAFYKQALNAELEMLMRFKDNPEPPPGTQSPEIAEKVMHASMMIGETRVMLSDGRNGGPSQLGFKGVTLTIAANSDDEAKRLFTALSDGGQVHMPLTKTFFSSSFGLVADRFGVSWMLLVRK